MCSYRPVPRDELAKIPVGSLPDSIAAATHIVGHERPAGTVDMLTMTGRQILNVVRCEREEDLAPLADDAPDLTSGPDPAAVILIDADDRLVTPIRKVAERIETLGGRVVILGARGRRYQQLYPEQRSDQAEFYQGLDSRYDHRARALGSAPAASIDELLAQWLNPIGDEHREQQTHTGPAAAYLIGIIHLLLADEQEALIGFMHLLIGAAAAIRQHGDDLTAEPATPLLLLLDHPWMQHLLRAFCQHPSGDVVLGVTCDLARYAGEQQRGSALALVALAALVNKHRTVAERALAMAEDVAAPDNAHVRYARDAIRARFIPPADPDTLDKAVRYLLNPPTLVYRVADVLGIAAATQNATTTMSPGTVSAQSPTLVVDRRQNHRLHGNIPAIPTTYADVLEIRDSDGWGPSNEIEIPIDSAMMDRLHQALAEGSTELVFERREPGCAELHVRAPAAEGD